MATPIKQIKTSDNEIHGIQATGILYGECDSTSTSTAFTAQVDGVTEYYDGLTILLKNGVVTSAANFTININGLGGKPSYNNMTTGNDITPTAPTRDTTVFNINYTMLITYSSTIVSGGGWIMYRGYDTNTNTIGYQLRTNTQTMPVASAMYRYRMLFTSADGKKYVPSNDSSATTTASAKTVTTIPIDPFGSIFYYGRTNIVSSGSKPGAAYLWQQYVFDLGYAFNRTSSALTMTTSLPVYVKCTPQADGSAIIDATTPIVQALPTTEDGKIYIFLGIATSATNVELEVNHPVYYYKNGALREWVNAEDVQEVIVNQIVASGTALASINGTTVYVPNASSSTAGITKVGASGGAASYSHTHALSDITGAAGYSHIHYVSTDSFVQSYPGSFTNIYPAANVTAVTGITNTATNVLSSVTGATFGISVSNGVLEIGSTIGISSLSPATTSVVRTVTASGSSSVRGTSISLMKGLGTAVTSIAVTAVNTAYEPGNQY